MPISRPAPGKPAPSATPPTEPANDPTGLVPVLPSASISRPRLRRLLDVAAGRRLTVVSAGAGWGKTTAVADWVDGLADDGPAVAWLTLDRASDEPARFWEALLGALRTAGVAAADPLSVLSLAGGLTDELVLTIHQRLRNLAAPVLLVLDDFHVIEDPQVLYAVATMVERATPMHLVVLTRIDPLLAVHRLRLSGELAEITADNLAFDRADVVALARSNGLKMLDSDIETVMVRTEGWPAGVRLAMLYLSRLGAGADLDGFAGTERSVAEYLVAEVLSVNTPQVQQFLLQTSIAEQVCAELAAAIVPGQNAQSVLELLEGRNEFVSGLGQDRKWFRYHPLLRELLEHSLRRDQPQDFVRAHRAAAGWLAAHGEATSALGHAAAAQDWELFANLYITAAAPSLVGRDRGNLERQLRAVPYAALPESAQMHLMRAGLAILTGDLGALREHADGARRMSARSPAPLPEGAEPLMELLTCAALRSQGDGKSTVRASSAAIAALDRSRGFPAIAGYRAIAANNRGIGMLWSGDPAGARDWLHRAAREAGVAGAEVIQISARAHLAFCDALESQLDAAETAADRALSDAAARGWSGLLQVRPAHIVAVRARLLRGEIDRCDATVAAGLAAVIGGAEPAPTLALRITQGWIAVSRGRRRAARLAANTALEAAHGWTLPDYLRDELTHMLTEVALLTDDPSTAPASRGPAAPSSPDSPTLLSTRARRLLAAQEPRSAQQVAASLTDSAEVASTADLVAVVDAWLVQALAADSRGLQLEATRALGEAVEIARPHRLVRPFLVTGGNRIPDLLRRLNGRQASRDPFTLKLLGHLGPGPSDSTEPEPEPLIEALTQRELAILTELPTMKNNAQIALDFYVSVNTVKTHLKGLYRKLGVNTRRDAVLRAQQLRLLPE